MTRAVSPELRTLLDAVDPRVRAVALAGRARILELAPEANELIYDAYNALSLAYSFTDRLGGAFCHLAIYTGHVNLGFNDGAALSDPRGVLRGAGRRIRHLRLDAAEDLESADVETLMRAATARARATAEPEPGSGGRSILMPTSGKKRRG